MKGEHQMRSFLLVALGALLLAVPAVAGGFATVGLAPPPAGIEPGDTWTATATILQHGRTPMDGLSPTLTIQNGDVVETFAFVPTKTTGVYTAQVRFPSGGEWLYIVDDGFTQRHTFAPVQVGDSAAGSGFRVPEWTWGLFFAALGLTAIALLARRSRPATAPVAQP
jgi:hypothetical protein